MKDLNERIRQRWQTRRRKSQNWQSLVVKVLLLVILFYLARKVLSDRDIDWTWLNKQPVAAQTQPAVKDSL